MKILVIHGPNLNMLGIREPNIYGKQTYQDLVNLIRDYSESKNLEVSFFQSNHEGALVDAIQQAYFDGVEGILINAGAYTHTSLAILDALKSTGIPSVEVHISNPKNREEFRHFSYLSQYCFATIQGKGFPGYLEAIDALIAHKENA
ncbi:MAG: type II 3-dehydroquinate dehydratase [Candidatus Enteromonas sp.]|nr:type II 3-dehydroquinate dehydratase [Candidatus Enteromonas sp.]